MNGPEDVAETIRAHLAAELPVELARVRTELGLTNLDLPNPATVTAQERNLLDLADWPAVFVLAQRLERLRRVDGLSADGATVAYLARYPVRVFVFVRGKGYEATDLLRKRYVRALREALFGSQEAVTLDEASYVESYSDVDEDRSKRTIAGAYADFAVEVIEELAKRSTTPAPDPAGWATELDLSLLPHPALD